MLDSKSIVEVYMALYKRNQVEEAIAKIVEKSTKPSPVLRTRLKRLLETDRAGVRGLRKRSPFAFFSAEAPGQGGNVWFSDYEVFALLVALTLLQSGWPKSVSVRLLRQVRKDLEREYIRIIAQDPKKLFDEKVILERARPGDIVVYNTDPVFLVIAARIPTPPQSSENIECVVCRGMSEVQAFVKQLQAPSWTMYELVNSAHQLKSQLSMAPARNRGRSRRTA